MTARPTITDPADLNGDEAAGRHLTTLEGWRQFTADPPPPPELLPRQRHEKLGDLERMLYDEARLDHHARLRVVATSAVRHAVTCGRRLVLLNRHAVSARRGLILSGPAGTGKTIAITQLGRAHELLDRARHPGRADRIPVVYITVPPAATPRMIAAEFARFLGLPVTRSANITDITEAVVGVCTDTRTGLVLVDELHNISLTSRSGAEVADTLKYFSERIPATFVYAGIDIERSNLLSGTRGAQIAGPLHPAAHPPLPLRRGMDRPRRHPGAAPPAPRPPPRHARRPRPPPPPPNRRHDRRPLPPDPRRGHRRDPHRHREDHQGRPGRHPARPRRPEQCPPRPLRRPPVTDTGDRPTLRPLPVRVAPRLGEGTDNYLRRLARANHLKPSYLNTLASPRSNTGRPDITLLAQLAARRPADLRRALADAPGKPLPEQREPAGQPEPPEDDFQRRIDLLFAYSDLRKGIPLRIIARRYKLHPRELRQSVQRQPPRRLTRVIPDNDTQRRRIRALAGAGRSTAYIWARMMDDHDTPLTNAAISDFLRRGRRSTATRR